jgi:hypothetical protein
MAMRKARLVGLKPGRSMPFLSRQCSAIGGSRIKAVAAAETARLHHVSGRDHRAIG